MSAEVTYEIVDSVAVVTIDRPAKRNAMSMAVFDGLRDAGRRAAKDSEPEDGIGAVLVRGAGGHFSAGIDVSALGEQADGSLPEDDWIAGLQESFTVFEDLDVPSIAAIDGYCLGAGIQLAAACHVRLVTPSAQLAVLETRWGLVPDLGGTYRLPRLVGLGRATELALTARRLTGEQAAAMGLCDVVLTGEDPMVEAHRYAAQVASGPGSVRRVPRLVRENLDRSREDALATERRTQLEVMAGPDFREAVTAGRERREPRFVGR